MPNGVIGMELSGAGFVPAFHMRGLILLISVSGMASRTATSPQKELIQKPGAACNAPKNRSRHRPFPFSG